MNIHYFKKNIFLLLIIVAVIFTYSPAGAVSMTSTLDGTVTADNAGTNPFGLSVGDQIFAEFTWDDSLVTGISPDEEISIDGLAGWDFTITLGSFSFSQADVTDPTWTAFWFNMGDIDGISFYLEDITVGAVSGLLIEDFSGGRSLFAEDLASEDPTYLEADWDFENAVTTPTNPGNPVPEPGTMVLFGVGLLALASVNRRRQV